MNKIASVVTIDGPSGAGKGTVSRAIAKSLGWHYLDSGSIYRALVVAIEKQGVLADDESKVVDAAKRLDLSYQSEPGFAVLLSGEDITPLLQNESCGNLASKIAAFGEVRRVLLGKQREFRKQPGLVADGRDMGTVVFPDAPYKIFLTASAEIRAQRRYKQLKEQGINVTLNQITAELFQRDRRDKARTNAPLVQAADAVYIDSSALTIDQVIKQGLYLIRGVY